MSREHALMKLLVKSGIEQLPLFEKENFSYYEAYLRGDEDDEDLHRLLQTEMKLISIHLPSVVNTPSGKKGVNFCDQGETGKASFVKLQELLNFTRRQQVPYLVAHLGFYDSLHEDRFTILKRTAQRFQPYVNQGVRVCLENVPCWTNICFENEPIISEVNHFLHFKKHCPNSGLTFDTDHLAITAVFQQFYAGFKKSYLASRDRQIFRRKMEQEMLQATRKDPDFFREVLEQKMAAFLSQVKPDIVHAVGSDFCQYQDGEKLPLVGEALPLGFKGMIKGFPVEDRIDHALWLSRIPKDTWITIELLLRPEYDYIHQIRKSIGYLSAAKAKITGGS